MPGHQVREFRRWPGGIPRSIDKCVLGGSRGDEFVAPTKFVVEMDAKKRTFLQHCGDLDFVVVDGRAMVFHIEGKHRELVAFLLEFEIGKSRVTKHIGAGDLQPGEITTVIDHAHHIGFSVAHPDGGFGFDHGEASRV